MSGSLNGFNLLADPLQKVQAVEKRRVLRHFNAEQASYSSTNANEIIIDISTPQELLDFQNGYLLFDLVATGSGPTTLKFNNWAASSWIREFRVEDRSGTQIGKSVQFYNGLCQLEYNMKSNNEANQSYLKITEGSVAYSDATDSAATSRQYAHRFISHIFTSPDYFPNFALSGLRLIITLEDAAAVVRGNDLAVTNPTYTVSNISYACDVVELFSSSMGELKKQLDGKKTLDIHYLRHYARRTTQFTDTQRFKVGVIDGAIKNVQYFSVLSSVRTGGSDYWASYSFNNQTSYRFYLNNKPLTDKTIPMSATRLSEYLIEYEKSQRINLDQLVYGNENLAITSRPVIGQRFDRATTDDVISSLRDEDNNEVEVDIEFSSSGAAATTYIYVLTDQQLSIHAGKRFEDVAVKPIAPVTSTMNS